MLSPLVVIDMQESYAHTGNKTLLKNVVKHVREAKKAKVPIIIVEFANYGETRNEIMKLLRKRYKNHVVVQKHACNGSPEVKKVLEKDFGILAPATLNLCGVFTQDCVAKTAKGLVEKGFEINVIEEACYANKYDHVAQVETWEQSGTVNVVCKGPDWR